MIVSEEKSGSIDARYFYSAWEYLSKCLSTFMVSLQEI